MMIVQDIKEVKKGEMKSTEFQLKIFEGGVSLNLLKRDTMSVRGWLEKCPAICMHDLNYAYHGLMPLLEEFSKKAKFLHPSGTDPECIGLLKKNLLVRGDDNYILSVEIKTTLDFVS